MAISDNSSFALSKTQIIALGVAVLILVATQGPEFFRHYFKSSASEPAPASPARINSEGQRSQADLKKICEELNDFNKWFLSDSDAPSVNITFRSRSGASARMLNEKGVSLLWPVPVSGTFATTNGFSALHGGNFLKFGDCIKPTQTKSGYKVLSISRRCVWFEAFEEGKKPCLLESAWPDLAGVRMSVDARSQAKWVELRQDEFAECGQGFEFDRTGGRLTVGRLWPNAVHFQYKPSGRNEGINLLCVVLPN
jgi:hypothetical protein